MTFRKFEFWLVTLAGFIIIASFIFIFIDEGGAPGMLGVSIGVVLIAYAVYLFLTFFVFDRLYNKKAV